MVTAERYLGVGESVRLANGNRVVTKTLEKAKRLISSVSKHEAIHAVIGVVRRRWVKRVTNIPGPGYEGLTELDAYDRAVTMGPEVANQEGTGSDVFNAEMHGDRESGAAEAAPIISSNTEEIDAVGEGLDEHRTLTHEGVVSYMELGSKRRRGIFSTVLELVRPDGKKEEKKIESEGGKVLIPGEWVDLPQAA